MKKRIAAAGLAALAFLFVSLALAGAQGDAAKPPAAGADFVDEKLDADEPDRKDVAQFNYLVLGRDSAPPLDSDQAKKVIDANLKWYLNRLTWESVQAAREGSISAIMEEILGGANNLPPSRVFPSLLAKKPGEDPDLEAARKRQRGYVVLLCKDALPKLQQLLRNKQLIVRVNAVRVLERFAEWGRDEVAETLVGILQNPKEHDAVRFWAIESLGHLLKDSAAAGNFGERDQNGARYRAAGMAIYSWLDAASSLPDDKVSQLTQEEQDAISYVRRHAAAALGGTLRPRLVDAPPGGGPPQGPVAELLVKIMDNNVSPPARLNERVEAARQLCRLQPRYSPAYQPDFVVQRLGAFYAALGAEAASNRNQRWRWYASQLKQGLDELEGLLAAGTPGQVYLGKAKGRMGSVLEFLDDAGKNPQAPQDLFNWLNQNPAPSKAAFRQ